ncbi:MAG: LLM class flavin-dependent oxidoreductase [Chloroflexi bacterium]|nr:LLM class flavin-dependent oxidoreductase [Chloroflexota bacterium]
MSRIDLGFKSSPQAVDWATIERLWELGGSLEVYDSAWLNDHLTDQSHDRGGASFEPMTLLAALARHVPRLRVGHLVLANTFRHPAVLAKEATVLDNVTGGRFILGLGAGWHEGEHRSLGIELPPIGERIDRFESAVRIIKALFSEEAAREPGVTLDAPPWRLEGAVNLPAPVHPGGPPLWLGGQRPRGLKIAARYADGWNFTGNLGDLDDFRERRDVLLRSCDEVGRDPAEITVSVQLPGGADATERRATVAKALEYVREGAQHLILVVPASRGPDGLQALTDDVAIPVRDALG